MGGGTFCYSRVRCRYALQTPTWGALHRVLRAPAPSDRAVDEEKIAKRQPHAHLPGRRTRRHVSATPESYRRSVLGHLDKQVRNSPMSKFPRTGAKPPKIRIRRAGPSRTAPKRGGANPAHPTPQMTPAPRPRLARAPPRPQASTPGANDGPARPTAPRPHGVHDARRGAAAGGAQPAAGASDTAGRADRWVDRLLSPTPPGGGAPRVRCARNGVGGSTTAARGMCRGLGRGGVAEGGVPLCPGRVHVPAPGDRAGCMKGEVWGRGGIYESSRATVGRPSAASAAGPMVRVCEP